MAATNRPCSTVLTPHAGLSLLTGKVREWASANAAGELTGCESQQAELAAVNSLLAISQVIQSGSKTALNAERGLSPSSDAQRALLLAREA